MLEPRPRNLSLERHLTETAAKAAGLPDGNALSHFADSRALPGGVRPGLQSRQEIAEELADARNYAVWGIEPLWEAYQAGDTEATQEVAQLLHALSLIVAAFHGLQTEPA